MSAVIEPSSLPAGPAWEIATLFPNQGDIGEADYLWLTRHVNRLVEFTDGRVEVLSVPTTQHQLILLFVFRSLLALVEKNDWGLVLFAPLRVKIRDGKFREPDIVFMAKANLERAQNEFWIGADLVIEIVSADNPTRDLVEKRRDYAEADIGEYWIIDPQQSRVTVLALQDQAYTMHSEATSTGIVHSKLLPGLSFDVAKVMAAGVLR